MLDEPVAQIGRQAVDLRHLPEAASRDVGLEVDTVWEAGGPCDGERIQQFVGIQVLDQRDRTQVEPGGR